MSEEIGQKTLSLGRTLSEIVKTFNADDPKELLKIRFLCREGILGLYGQTGLGKSSLLMQCLILWALAREAFGIKPRQALKSLLIQAENDDGDIMEMCKGVCEGLGLTPEETQLACDNIIVIQEDSKYGSEFIGSVVLPELALHKPDLVCIDCALSYLGGDVISQEVVSQFLRNELKPLLKIHQCGCILVHHTNKTGNSDNAYAGSGSAEFANMPRAILILSPIGKGTFELTAAKRGNRLKWKMPDGKTTTIKKRLKHSSVDGQICWLELDAEESAKATHIDDLQTEEEMVLSCIPENSALDQVTLRVMVNQKGLGQNKVQKRIEKMVKEGKLFKIKVPRENARPEIHFSRSPPKGVTGG